MGGMRAHTHTHTEFWGMVCVLIRVNFDEKNNVEICFDFHP